MQSHKMARAFLTPASTRTGVAQLTADIADLVTIHGVVTSLEPVDVISAVGKLVAIRKLRVKEGVAEVAVCLWREANLVQISNGAPIVLTHLRVKNTPDYGFSLHSTSDTEIQMVPLQTVIDVKGSDIMENGDVVLLDGCLTEVIIRKEVWGFGEDVPTKLLLSYDGGEVSQATIPLTTNEI